MKIGIIAKGLLEDLDVGEVFCFMLKSDSVVMVIVVVQVTMIKDDKVNINVVNVVY